MSSKILVIDDDSSFCLMIKTFLIKKGYEVANAFSFSEAERILSTTSFDLVLTDIRLPESNGVEILKLVKAQNPKTQVILITGYSDIKTAVQVMKLGAFDYISKPIHSEEMLRTISEALSKKTVIESVNANNYNPQNKTSTNNQKLNEFVIGNSCKSQELNQFIEVVAPTNISVLIIGDSGTGKENIAYSIHQKSKRASLPYIAVDCGAIPKDLAASEFFGHLKGSFTGATTDKIGHFEAANGGTIFLDEVGNLSYDVQIQLLRALQERKVKPVGSSKEIQVDIRVIAATNEDLQKAVRQGNFREDLYHRLNEFSIIAPKLCQRGNDILVFADFFLKQSNKDLEKNIKDFSPEVKAIFLNYQWPGNLREMRNVIRRSMLLTLGDIVEKSVLPIELTAPQQITVAQNTPIEQPSIQENLKLYSSENEAQTIKLALEKSKFNKTKAAQLLGVDRKTLYNKLKLYNIEL